MDGGMERPQPLGNLIKGKTSMNGKNAKQTENAESLMKSAVERGRREPSTMRDFTFYLFFFFRVARDLESQQRANKEQKGNRLVSAVHRSKRSSQQIWPPAAQ